MPKWSKIELVVGTYDFVYDNKPLINWSITYALACWYACGLYGEAVCLAFMFSALIREQGTYKLKPSSPKYDKSTKRNSPVSQ